MKRIRIIIISFFILMGSSLFINQNSSDTNDSQSIDTNLKPTSQEAPIIADHTIINTTRLDQIPESIINQTKDTLQIAYGHTSHGSQLITGMSGLSSYKEANGGTLGLFDWHDSRIGGDPYNPQEGVLNIDDYFRGWDDLGHNGDVSWATTTRDYLDRDEFSSINVVMWSWCGGASDNTEEGINTYLNEVTELEEEYPDISFVYMTGHADGTGEEGNLHIRNQQIRNYCIENDKILYDFYDIECYDPDGNYFGDLNVTDTCAFDSDENGSLDGNWATSWEGSHTEDEDWYECESAHSQALNANMKAYAAWWMFCRIAGWDGSSSTMLPSISDETGGYVEYSAETPSFSWEISNFIPTQHEIFINDVGQGRIDSISTSITFNFAAFSLGAFNISLKVFNGSGDWIQDDLDLNIQDTTFPLLEQPLQNLIAGLDESTIPLTWDLFDLLGDYYILSLNNVVEVEAVWDGEDISYSLTNPGVGEYNVSLYLNDTSGNSVIFSQMLYISDCPQILSHENCSFEQDSVSNLINWTCYDSNPAFYQFYVNSVSQGILVWDGEEVNFAFDGYAIGVYNLTLWVNDTEGNWDQETIFITVVAQTTTTTDSTTTTETSSTSDTSTTTSDLPPSSETTGSFLGISINTLVGAGFGAGFLGLVVVMAVVIKKQR